MSNSIDNTAFVLTHQLCKTACSFYIDLRLRLLFTYWFSNRGNSGWFPGHTIIKLVPQWRHRDLNWSNTSDAIQPKPMDYLVYNYGNLSRWAFFKLVGFNQNHNCVVLLLKAAISINRTAGFGIEKKSVNKGLPPDRIIRKYMICIVKSYESLHANQWKT